MLMRFLRSNVLNSTFPKLFVSRSRIDVSRGFSDVDSSSLLLNNSVRSKPIGDGTVSQVSCVPQYHPLYVGNLSIETTENMLREHFCKYGMVVRVKVVRDQETLKSRGHGFVVFADKQALDNAMISQLHMVGNQKINVHPVEEIGFVVSGLSRTCTKESLKMYFSRYGRVFSCGVKHSPQSGMKYAFVNFASGVYPELASLVHVIDGKEVEVRRILPKKLKLRVSGLSPETTNESLAVHFAEFGNILQATVERDRLTGQSRGFGHVCFSSQQGQDSALRSLPHVINGKEVMLDYNTLEFTLFVADLASTSTEQSLKQYFEQFGPIYGCRIARDNQTSEPRDFGWITFSTGDGYKSALEARPLVVDGKQIEVWPSRKQESRLCTLYVRGLSPRTTEAMLNDVFSKYGSLVRCHIKFSKISGRSKGFGYAAYSTPHEVSEALRACPHVIDGRVVEVKLCNQSALCNASSPSAVYECENYEGKSSST